MLDNALLELDKLIGQLDNFLQNHYNEADTRVKFIDPLLTSVLGWNEHLHIRREENYITDEQRRCIDYILCLTEPVLIVEAKKTLKNFEIPLSLNRIDYSLDGVIQTWENAWSAILQAHTYCVDKGARYALVTNGHQYIAFKAISERGSWFKGHALVIGSPEILRKNFTKFYECLSKNTISQDMLSDFAFPHESHDKRIKPRTSIKFSNIGYRNELYSILDDAFRNILLDIPSNDSNFLKNCYCSSTEAMRYSGHLNAALVDPLPFFRTPIEEVRPGYRKDPFNSTITQNKSGNPLFVIMGGAGVGKTSFLHWYFIILPKNWTMD